MLEKRSKFFSLLFYFWLCLIEKHICGIKYHRTSERCFTSPFQCSQKLVVDWCFHDNDTGDDWRHNSVDGFRTVNH